MGIRKYPLPGGDGNESKVVYTLGLRMRMRMNFYYEDEDEIMIPVPTPPRCHPYIQQREGAKVSFVKVSLYFQPLFDEK